jgi:hypothetical protein
LDQWCHSLSRVSSTSYPTSTENRSKHASFILHSSESATCTDRSIVQRVKHEGRSGTAMVVINGALSDMMQRLRGSARVLRQPRSSKRRVLKQHVLPQGLLPPQHSRGIQAVASRPIERICPAIGVQCSTPPSNANLVAPANSRIPESVRWSGTVEMQCCHVWALDLFRSALRMGATPLYQYRLWSGQLPSTRPAVGGACTWAAHLD